MSTTEQNNGALLDARAYMKKNHPAFDTFYGTGHITDIAAALSKTDKSNVILTGAKGVGKTTQILAIVQKQELIAQTAKEGISGDDLMKSDFVRSSVPYPLLRNDYFFLDTEILFNTENKAKIERDLNAAFDTLEKISKKAEENRTVSLKNDDSQSNPLTKSKSKMPVLVIEDMELFIANLRRFHIKSVTNRLHTALSENRFKTIMMVKDVPGINRAKDLIATIPHGENLFTTINVKESDEPTTAAILKETREHLMDNYTGITLSDEAEAELLSLSNKFKTNPYFETARPARDIDLRAAIIADFYAQEMIEPKAIRVIKRQIDDLEAQDNLSTEQQEELEEHCNTLGTLITKHQKARAYAIQMQMAIAPLDEKLSQYHTILADEKSKIIALINTNEKNKLEAQAKKSMPDASEEDIKAHVVNELEKFNADSLFDDHRTNEYNETFSAIVNFQDDIGQLNEKLRQYDAFRHKPVTIEPSDVREIFTKLTGVDAKDKSLELKKRLLKAEELMKKGIIGQDDAINAVIPMWRSAEIFNNGKRKKPIGSFLFVGPSGVGKTEFAKILAEIRDVPLHRVDMSEYQTSTGVNTLLGSDAGYAGYDEGGKLTGKVRKEPASVVLWDEVEKADASIMDIGLQMMDEGNLSDKRFGEVKFNEALVIMTSNLHNAKISEIINESGLAGKALEDRIKEQLLKPSRVGDTTFQLKPEFLNRFSGIVIFKDLTNEDMYKIARLNANSKIAELVENGITVTISDETIKDIVDTVYVPADGARNVKKVVTDNIESQVGPIMLEASMDPDFNADKGLHVEIGFDIHSGKIIANKVTDKKSDAQKRVATRRAKPEALKMTG